MNMKDKGYAISAQKKTAGKPTTGGSPKHAMMKPKVMKYETMHDNGKGAHNKNMYKTMSGDKK